MILEKLQKVFPAEILAPHEERGETTAVVRKDQLHPILVFLKNDPSLAFEALVDLCGVDYLPQKPRFEVVYHFFSLTHNRRLRLRVKVPEEDLLLPTATDLWESANWFEREVYDMFGVRFAGHPNLKRLLMFEEFEGHPLRKDYPIKKRQQIPVSKETL